MLTIPYILLILSRFTNPFIISLDTQTTSLEAGVLVPNSEMRKLKLSDSHSIIEAKSEEQESNTPFGLLTIPLLP